MSTFAELRGVTVKRRRSTIIDDVDLDLEATGLTLLGGENGAGKSTLLHTMCGLIVPTSGTISIDGHDLAHASGRKAMRGTIVLLPQAPTCRCDP